MCSRTAAVAAFLLGVTALASCGETPTSTPPPPRIEFGAVVYDAGRVRQGERVEHSFVFRNSGRRDLRISRVRASCDCAASGPESVVSPGETAEIVTSFDTSGLFGKITRTTTVFSNDPAAPAVRLQVTADVDFDVASNPPEFYVGIVRAGEEVSLPARLAVAANTSVLRVESQGNVIDARLIEPAAEGAPPGERRFRVRIREQAPAGRFRENVILHTTSQRTPTLSVPVVGVVEKTA